MIVEELRQVIEQVQQLPEDAQRHIAALIEAELEEREWDALVSTPGSQRFLAILAEEARQEIAEGKTRDLDELL
jgi:DnaJ-domain-containing protein 1